MDELKSRWENRGENILEISIGGTTSPTYWHVMQTDAPKEYDGFGTFCVCEFDGQRVVLIRDEHLSWQSARYSSGLHSCNKSSLPVENVAEYLWRRVRGVIGQHEQAS